MNQPSDIVSRAIRDAVARRVVPSADLIATAGSVDERRVLENLRTIIVLNGCGVPDADNPTTQTIGVSAPEADPGDRWGPLEILEVIGRGAHGTVFRAWDTRLAREIALKLMRADGPGVATETLREARLLARVQHPGVVTVFGADRYDGSVGWWMELIDGLTLEQILQAQGASSAEEAALIGRETCAALSAVHRAGLVHGDIKLQNIMRERRGRIVLMDFGTGRTQETPDPTGALSGTPLYLAPEVLAGSAPTIRSDIFALGAALFRLVTGDFPVPGDTIRQLRIAHETGARRSIAEYRPELPQRFTAAVERALSHDPGERFESASAFGRALHIHPAPERSPLSRLPLAVAGVALLVGGALAGRWLSIVPDQRVAPTASRAAGELSPSTLKLWTGFEQIAREHALRGEFVRAAESYTDAIGVLRQDLAHDAPAVAACYGKAGWMWHLAGRAPEARTNLQLAIHGLHRASAIHPLRGTLFTALTASWQTEGNVDEALKAWREGVAIRQQALGMSKVDASRAFEVTGVAEERWRHALGVASVAADADNDRLSDAVEVALGLNPASPRSRGVVGDGDDDVDGDGWPDVFELGMEWDPTAVVSHFGHVNPLEMGFTAVRRFESGPVTIPGVRAPGWSIKSDNLGHYSYALPGALKRAALDGFTLTVRSRLLQGGAYASLDLLPAGPRFDTDTYFTPGGTLLIKQNTSIVPHEGAEHALGDSPAPLVQLHYRRDSGGVLWIGGQKRSAGYRGFTGFQDDSGLFFGAYNRLNAVPHGEAQFALVHLVIDGWSQKHKNTP